LLLLVVYSLLGLASVPSAVCVIVAFSLAWTIGFVTPGASGGIGVREGIITAYLVMSGVELELATTISVLSRIWFVLGEIFIFMLALVLNVRK